ncbi:PDZ domain containing 8 isoform X2 [Lycorma delicatula]|uniref:PDZ domain containing 8 isoform X2 n=1 Tax=Lycorma delicatula TaxID=130591 RepID=UPI003F511B7C
MDFFVIIILVVFSFVTGIFLTLLVQWYIFNLYIMKLPYIGPSEKPLFESFKLPEELRVSMQDAVGKSEDSLALNALFQLLFQECRNLEKVRLWFRQRLSLELEELLTRTTTGKLFESIALRDLDLGSQFPTIKSIVMKELNIDSNTKLINDVELCLDLDYRGGFQLSIDAAMRLSKTAHVSVKVNQLIGQGRLKFTRNPYTHWSFCFYTDPTLQLSVESQFQGRSLPQINSIIASQIRKSLKRKHTLPFYKVRYKPFFSKNDPTFLDEVAGSVPNGILDVTVIEVTRVNETNGPVFCSLAVDAMAWVEMINTELGSYLTIDIAVNKGSAGQFGVNFKQEFVPDKYQVCVVVDSVSSSIGSDVRLGDILVAVDGKRVNSLSNVAKCIKQGGERISLRLERRIKIIPPPEEKAQESFGLRQRRGSSDKTDSDSSNSTSLSDSPARRSLRGSPEHKVKLNRLSVSFDCDNDANTKLQVLNTKEQPYSDVISYNETLRFYVNSEHRYLNLSVWSKGEKNMLLGHISLPLASQCCIPASGYHIKLYSLLPPDPHLVNTLNHPLSSHPGFEPCLCFGDILLAISFISSSASTLSLTTSAPQPQPPVITAVPTLPVSSTLAPVPTAQHDFVRTHFTRATQCGFCFKKIWLKDAFQCGGCMMTCHKKCVSKCQASSSCALTQLVERRASVHPEIITTSPDEPDPIGQTEDSVVDKNTSLVGGGTLFTLNDGDDEEISVALEQLLSRPQDEELNLDVAKASGRQLFADLPPDLRKQRIDAVMTKLKAAIDAESHVHMKLVKEEQGSLDTSIKARTAFLIGKSEEKLQAMTVLMLHCCAGLQDAQDNLPAVNSGE